MESLSPPEGVRAAVAVAGGGAEELAGELGASRRAASAPLQARAAIETATRTRKGATMSVFE